MSQFIPHWRGQAAGVFQTGVNNVATIPKPFPSFPDNSLDVPEPEASVTQEPEVDVVIPPSWARVNFDKVAGALGDKGSKGASRRLQVFKDVIEEHWSEFVFSLY